MINDIVKTNIKTKLEAAMEKEGLKPSETARIFGIHPNYVSMIKNPDTWMKCPASTWDLILSWINSGQGLTEYSEKHGHVLPEKYEPKQDTVISRVIEAKPVQTMNHDQIISTIEKSGNGRDVLKPVELSKVQNQKVIIDIEINLIINGKKVNIS